MRPQANRTASTSFARRGRILSSLARVITGYLTGCLASGVIQVLFVLPLPVLVGADGQQLQAAGVWMLLAGLHNAAFASPFALAAVLAAERGGVRGPGYYLAVGTGIAIIGFVLQMAGVYREAWIVTVYVLSAFIVSGAGGALAYWLTTGRRAGG